jgi:hypothetical protein
MPRGYADDMGLHDFSLGTHVSMPQSMADDLGPDDGKATIIAMGAGSRRHMPGTDDVCDIESRRNAHTI